ncbi:dTDP-4-dehydrorhamnose reductase [Microbacterium sp. HJ5]
MSSSPTAIPGLYVWDLPVHGDNRGWFKENWQRQKMVAAGLEDFGPVQNNVSFNDAVGTTRGFHAEPWDKWVSVATGRIFGAWVDLREGPTFGASFACEIDPSLAVFVPRGVGNAFQTLEPGTAYSYLVNDHWSPDAVYTFLNLADETVAMDWPIPLDEAELSEKDREHPRMAQVTPVPPRRILVLGAGGQLGSALRAAWRGAAHVEFATRTDIDLAGADLAATRNWSDYGVIVNAAAFTAVDGAETEEGRAQAWAANAAGVRQLAGIAAAHGITLVHISTDYVFDGTLERPYVETDPVAPLGVYGQSKAAGDLAVSLVPRHYVLRTSWVIGDGKNFVRTMASLAERGIDPSVVDDQIGRLTHADDIARGILHLLARRAPYGTYNLTGGGAPMSWAGVARAVFTATGHDPGRVRPVTTAEYFAGSATPIARRPANSVLSLAKIEETGFAPLSSDDVIARALGS